MSWFPFHYRDVKALAKDGLYLSTSSNEAAKLFDSAVTQVALHDQDPQDGNLMETTYQSKVSIQLQHQNTILKSENRTLGNEYYQVLLSSSLYLSISKSVFIS